MRSMGRLHRNLKGEYLRIRKRNSYIPKAVRQLYRWLRHKGYSVEFDSEALKTYTGQRKSRKREKGNTTQTASLRLYFPPLGERLIDLNLNILSTTFL